LAHELGILALKSLLLVFERVKEVEVESTGFEFIIFELAARGLGSVGIRGWVLRSGSFHVVVVVVVTVVTVVTSMTSMTVRANLELIYVLAARRLGSIRGWVLRSGNLSVVVMVVVVVGATMTDVFTTFTYGLSNDGCDGSSSKNECNGEFDLNHF